MLDGMALEFISNGRDRGLLVDTDVGAAVVGTTVVSCGLFESPGGLCKWVSKGLYGNDSY
jgi:hypothetical protein